jgi:hypothetical protein
VRARVVRRQASEHIGVDFIDLAPEDRNAIQLYVMGRLSEHKQPRSTPDFRVRGVFNP